MVAHSNVMPEVVTLKRHFHDARTGDAMAYSLGEYLGKNCKQKGVYYLLECATDKYKNGDPRFPGGTGNSEDDYNIKNNNMNNSLMATTNSPRGGNFNRYYFNIKKPYCIYVG